MSITLDHLLQPISHWLDDPAVEEVAIQKPGEAWVFSRGGFTRHEVNLDADEIEDIAIVAAAQRRQDIGHQDPILDTDLKGRGRLGAVLYPCVAEGKPSIAIRRGSVNWPTFSELGAAGLFDKTKAKRVKKFNPTLVELYQEERWEEFFTLGVAEGLTMLGAGITASGKTHFMKAAIRAIPKRETRLVTIEDAPELVDLDKHYPNCVQFYYNKAGDAKQSAKLVEASLRFRPERLIVQEVRDGEAALAFLYALQTGHKGMTTIHADDCAGAFQRIKYVINQNPAGAAMEDEDILAQLRNLVDVVVHMERDRESFGIDEVWFRGAPDLAN